MVAADGLPTAYLNARGGQEIDHVRRRGWMMVQELGCFVPGLLLLGARSLIADPRAIGRHA